MAVAIVMGFRYRNHGAVFSVFVPGYGQVGFQGCGFAVVALEMPRLMLLKETARF